jgi:hypothetical protein
MKSVSLWAYLDHLHLMSPLVCQSVICLLLFSSVTSFLFYCGSLECYLWFVFNVFGIAAGELGVGTYGVPA